MIISPIVACDLHSTIGRGGTMPWHLPGDLRFFVQKTMGKPMIMGRRTFETLPGPLKGRLNIVLTRSREFSRPGIRVTHSPDEALQLARQATSGDGEIMILGGATVYEEFLPRADRLYLTVIHHRFEGGDTFFPAFDLSQWETASVQHHDADADNAYPYSFYILERDAPAPLSVTPLTAPRDLPEQLQWR